MRSLFETTWTCDNCGNPNLQSDDVCRHCGARKPGRYGKYRIWHKRIKMVFWY